MNSRCGFSKDKDNLRLLEIFKNNTEFKEVHIDIYSSDPFNKTILPVLILRRNANNVIISKNNKSIIVKANDKYNTYIAELVLNNINEIYYKEDFKNNFNFVLNYQNIFYKITIFK